MAVTVGFWVAFSVTVVLILVSLLSGFTRRRRLHVVIGPMTMVVLAVTVVFTEQLVRRFEFPEQEMGIHLLCAKTAAFLAVPVVVTGLLLLRRPRLRLWHRASVLSFVAMTLVATATGIWVFMLATPK